jgi:multidrug efflux pump subunit AcrA (membrane-fusion protein)
MTTAGHQVTWPARIARISEGIDPRTQSVGIIVEVDNPIAQAQPGRRPPLRRGMFVEVVMSAPAIQALIAPSAAVWGGKAFVVNADNTIERRRVVVGFEKDGLAMIRDGLSAGDRLVVSDATLVVEGMAVQPIEDEALAARIAGGTVTQVPGSGKGRGKAQ